MRPLFPSAVGRYVGTYRCGREEYNNPDESGEDAREGEARPWQQLSSVFDEQEAVIFIDVNFSTKGTSLRYT